MLISKKVKGILLILLALILLIIYRLTFHDNSINTNNNLNSEVTIDKRIYSNIYEELDYKAELTVLSSFFQYINDKNYKAAYELLDEDYVKDFNITLDTFKLRYSYNEKINFSILNISKYTNTYIADLIIGEEGKEGYIRKKVSILISNNMIKLADEGITSTVNINHSKEVGENIQINILKKYLLTNGSVFIININNISEKALELKQDQYSIFAITDNQEIGHKYYQLGTERYTYYPSIDYGNIPIFFSSSYIDSIYITLNNGKVIQL